MTKPFYTDYPDDDLGVTDFLESRQFYELMQAYRNQPLDAAFNFNAVKAALRTELAATSAKPIEANYDSIINSVKMQPVAQTETLPEHERKVLLSYISEMGAALRKLSFCAQTSGGTAGKDEGLLSAIQGASEVLSLAGISRIMVDTTPLAATSAKPDQGEVTDAEVYRAKNIIGFADNVPTRRALQDFSVNRASTNANPAEATYHLREYGDVTKTQMDEYAAIEAKPSPVQGEPVAAMIDMSEYVEQMPDGSYRPIYKTDLPAATSAKPEGDAKPAKAYIQNLPDGRKRLFFNNALTPIEPGDTPLYAAIEASQKGRS